MKAMIRWITLCALILVAPIASGIAFQWGYAGLQMDTACTVTLSINEGGVYSSAIFNLVLANGNTGTYTANAITDPGFADFVSHLQNGVNGNVSLVLTGNNSGKTGSAADLETAVFTFPLPENITGITMTVTTFTLINAYNGGHGWTEGDINVTFAAVPEPSSLFLLVVGLSAIGLRRPPKRK